MSAVPIPAEFFVDDEPLAERVIESMLDAYDTNSEHFDIDDDHPSQRFSIDDDSVAAWAMSKYAEAAAIEADVLSRYVQYAERIEEWRVQNLARSKGAMSFFGGHLEDYALRRRLADEKQKTLSLPDGAVKTRKSNARAVVSDEPKLIEWASEHDPSMLSYRVSLSKVRDAVTLLEVPMRVVLTCGCIVLTWTDGDSSPADVLSVYERGSACYCESCGQDQLVGDWLHSELYPVDANGVWIPGVDVDSGGLSASISPK